MQTESLHSEDPEQTDLGLHYLPILIAVVLRSNIKGLLMAKELS